MTGNNSFKKSGPVSSELNNTHRSIEIEEIFNYAIVVEDWMPGHQVKESPQRTSSQLNELTICIRTKHQTCSYGKLFFDKI